MVIESFFPSKVKTRVKQVAHKIIIRYYVFIGKQTKLTENKEMLSLKAIQDALKKVSIRINQDKIAEFLATKNLIANQLKDDQLNDIVAMFQEANSQGAGLARVNANAKTKATLGLPKEYTNRETIDIPESDTNASRQDRDSKDLGSLLVETAEVISDRNLQMAYALPELVGDMTKKKLVENKSAIDARWQQTNSEIMNILF